MRKVAKTRHHLQIRQVILYQDTEGVYLFPCTSLEDGFANGDHWYESLESAEAACQSEYGILREDWQSIPDPLEHCQHDWIQPVRVLGRDQGTPKWGRLERLVEGQWQEIQLTEGEWRYLKEDY
jgi:hypothetical protein